jgi:MFS family permease
VSSEPQTIAIPRELPTSARYAWFVLIVLVVVYGANFVDRYIFIIMMEPIKLDLRLSDTQLGLISGFAFSAVYSIAGLAAARWADLGNRRTLLAAAVAGWSLLTAACGLTRNFLQLLVVRMGVGVAESACSPPAHSLISDYFPPRKRGVAFSIYSMGLYVGLAVGFILGGWIGERMGWRAAFIILGLPGILIAVFTFLTVREPRRGAADSGLADEDRYSAREVLTYLAARPSFVAYTLGSSLYTFAGTAIDSWAPLFVMRVHDLSSGQVGLWTGVLGASAGFTGSIAGGWIADRLSARDLRWYLWVATAGISVVVPATLLFLFVGVRWIFVFYVIGVFFNSFYMPATIAVSQAVLPVRMRALSSAALLFGYNLIGTAGCNFVIGYFSDLWADSLHADSVRYAMAVTLLAAVGGVACTVFAIARLPRDFPAHFAR